MKKCIHRLGQYTGCRVEVPYVETKDIEKGLIDRLKVKSDARGETLDLSID